MDLKEVRWGDVDSIDVAEVRDRWREEGVLVNAGSVQCGEFLD